MEITITKTKRDYAEFNRYWFLKKNLGIILIIILVLAALLPFMLSPETEFKWDFHLKFSIIAFLVLAFLFLTGILFTTTMFKTVSFAKGYDGGTSKYIFDESGIIEVTGYENINIKWTEVKSFRQSKNLYILFVSGMDSIVIPKRDLTDAETRERFLILIRKNIN